MPDLGVELVNERRVSLQFERFPEFAHDRLYEALERIEKSLEAAVRAHEPHKTGRLESETGGRVYDHANRIAAVVGVRAPTGDDAVKAAALEWGAHRVTTVSAHSATLSHLWERPISPIDVEIAEHERHLNIAEHRFLRDPIAEIRAEALGEMKQALGQAAKDAVA